MGMHVPSLARIPLAAVHINDFTIGQSTSKYSRCWCIVQPQALEERYLHIAARTKQSAAVGKQRLASSAEQTLLSSRRTGASTSRIHGTARHSTHAQVGRVLVLAMA